MNSLSNNGKDLNNTEVSFYDPWNNKWKPDKAEDNKFYNLILIIILMSG